MFRIIRNIRVDLDRIIDLNLEGFLDLLCELAGDDLLMDVTYKIVGHTDNSVLFEVSGESERYME